jgi:hypothetical protein
LHLLSDDDPRFLALCVSIQRGGFDHDKPITIDEHGRILDGRHRWRAAKRLGLETVPCIERAEAEAATVILNSIVARKHYTKSALAFEVYPFFKAAHEEAVRMAQQARLRKLKQGVEVPSTDSVGRRETVDQFAAAIGVSTDLFQQAANVHKIFAFDPSYAEQMIPRIYAEPVGGEHESTRPVGLGAVIAGYQGKTRTEDKAKPVYNQLDLFADAVATTFHRWTKIEDVEAARPALRKVVAEMSDEEAERLGALVDELKLALRNR